jgi:hypothetical protein
MNKWFILQCWLVTIYGINSTAFCSRYRLDIPASFRDFSNIWKSNTKSVSLATNHKFHTLNRTRVFISPFTREQCSILLRASCIRSIHTYLFGIQFNIDLLSTFSLPIVFYRFGFCDKHFVRIFHSCHVHLHLNPFVLITLIILIILTSKYPNKLWSSHFRGTWLKWNVPVCSVWCTGSCDTA